MTGLFRLSVLSGAAALAMITAPIAQERVELSELAPTEIAVFAPLPPSRPAVFVPARAQRRVEAVRTVRTPPARIAFLEASPFLTRVSTPYSPLSRPHLMFIGTVY